MNNSREFPLAFQIPAGLNRHNLIDFRRPFW